MKSVDKILIVLVLIVCPAAAWGDFDPCEINGFDGYLQDLHQDGQDVHMKVNIVSVEECESELYFFGDVWRRSPNGNRQIDNGPLCEGVELVDHCVPPGTTTYDLSSAFEAGVLTVCLASTSIDVADSGSNCTPANNEDISADTCADDDDSAGDDTSDDDAGDDTYDDDADDDAWVLPNDSEDTSDNDDSACGGCEAGGENPGPVLFAVMFVVGLVALIFTRRK